MMRNHKSDKPAQYGPPGPQFGIFGEPEHFACTSRRSMGTPTHRGENHPDDVLKHEEKVQFSLT